MTTYTLEGYTFDGKPFEGGATFFAQSTLEFVVEDTATSFTYAATGTYDFGAGSVQEIALQGNFVDIRIDGFDYFDVFANQTEQTTIQTWTDFSQPAEGEWLVFYDPNQNLSYVFRLSGDGFPAFASPAEVNAFFSGLDVLGNPLPGSQAGEPIELAGNTALSSTESDFLEGTAGADNLGGDIQLSDDTIFGGEGDDVISGGVGNDSLDGGTDDDLVLGGDGNDIIYDGLGNDTVDGGNDNDTVYHIIGASPIDTDQLSGGAGIDTLILDNTSLDGSGVIVTVNFLTSSVTRSDDGGGASDDTITNFENFTALGTSGVSITTNNLSNILTLSSGDDTIDAAGQADTVLAGDGNDSILAGWGNDSVQGQGGNDTIDGGAGLDTIIGGSGNDVIDGGDDSDTIFGSGGADTMTGGTGSDTFFVDGEGDVVHGGTGYDTALWNIGGGITVSMAGWSGVEKIVAFIGNDVIDGSSQTTDLFMLGREGNDTITGGTGNDAIIGFTGADSITGGSGNDTMLGGTGNDVFNGGAGSDIAYVEDDGDVFDGGADYDRLIVNDATGVTLTAANFSNVELIRGYTGADSVDATGKTEALFIVGDGGNDTITGGSGDDRLIGNADNDVLNGAAGADFIAGGTGADTIEGGAGVDFMRGDAGADVFVFDDGSGNDTIADYLDGTDSFDFSAHSQVGNFSDLTVTGVGAGTQIEINATNETILLLGVTFTDIDASDFSFA